MADAIRPVAGRDVRCWMNPGSEAESGKVTIDFGFKKGSKGTPHKLDWPFPSVQNASAEDFLRFEQDVVLPFIQSHSMYSGRNSATSGLLLDKNPNGFVCVHGTEDEMHSLISLQSGQPGDNIHLLLPISISALHPGDSGNTVPPKQLMRNIKPLVAAAIQNSPIEGQVAESAAASGGGGGGGEGGGAFTPAPLPRHFVDAVHSELSKLNPHGVLLSGMASVLASGALPPRSTHVLLGVSKSYHATHCKLECFGGKRHVGETSLQGALREFEEESGIPRTAIHVQCDKPLLVGLRPMDALFVARVAVGSPPEEEDQRVQQVVGGIYALPKFGGGASKGRGGGRRGGRGGGKARGNWGRRGGHSGHEGGKGKWWREGRAPQEGVPEDR